MPNNRVRLNEYAHYANAASYDRDVHWHVFAPSFCEAFKQMRKSRGIETIDIVNALGKRNRKIVSHWECADDPRFPDICELDFICTNIFQCEIEEVLGYSPSAGKDIETNDKRRVLQA